MLMLYLYALNWSEIVWKDLEVPVLKPRTLRFTVRYHDHYTMQYCMRSHAKLRMTSFFVNVCCLTRPFLAWIKKFKKYSLNAILVSMDRSQCPKSDFMLFVPVQLFFTDLFAFKVSSLLANPLAALTVQPFVIWF